MNIYLYIFSSGLLTRRLLVQSCRSKQLHTSIVPLNKTLYPRILQTEWPCEKKTFCKTHYIKDPCTHRENLKLQSYCLALHNFESCSICKAPCRYDESFWGNKKKKKKITRFGNICKTNCTLHKGLLWLLINGLI